MKKYLRNIAALAFACFFLFAGTGMNIVKYCCDVCSDSGIEEVAANSCGASNHEKSSCCDTEQQELPQNDIADSDFSNPSEGCHLTRLNVEIPTIVSEKHIGGVFQHLTTVIFFELFSVYQANQFTTSKLITHSPPDFSLPSGREILSIKAVLII